MTSEEILPLSGAEGSWHTALTLAVNGESVAATSAAAALAVLVLVGPLRPSGAARSPSWSCSGEHDGRPGPEFFTEFVHAHRPALLPMRRPPRPRSSGGRTRRTTSLQMGPDRRTPEGR
ncbi:hypothetical protein [Streptomyces sp. bgisy034]|uniref:hypothetical protein n=1 Tax=Streptomyces sp. bgisy034 TaxID=3413774 RepID=UPI003EBBD6ED